MVGKALKIGAVAKRTGLTVRTLHHYDQIGLLKPSAGTESGHRLYTDSDIARLHQIVLLKKLGFALEEIKEMINNADFYSKDMLNVQLARMNEQIGQWVELRDRLQGIAALLDVGGAVSSEHFLMAIQMMNMLSSSHFSEAHKAEMIQKYRTAAAQPSDQTGFSGDSGDGLLAAFREMKDKGRLPGDPEVAPLAQRWILEVEAIAPEGFIQSAERYYSENMAESIAYGMDGELYAFIKDAVAHLKLGYG